MIIRPTQKLAKKIKVKGVPEMPLDENPFADWSANVFTAGRSQYILFSNTKSLYSTLIMGRGITSGKLLLESCKSAILETLKVDGHLDIYREIDSMGSEVLFAKTHSRGITGSMNEIIKITEYWLLCGDIPPHEIIRRMNETPLSLLAWAGSHNYGTPNEAIRKLAEDFLPRNPD